MPLNLSRLCLRPAMRPFSQAVQHTPAAGGGAVERRGVFDRAHEVVTTGGDGLERSSVAPVLGIRLVEWTPHPVYRDAIQIGGETFTVHDVQPDGQGGADIILKATG